MARSLIACRRLAIPPTYRRLRPTGAPPFLSLSLSLSLSHHHDHSLFAPPERHVSMPIDFYRVLRVEKHFLGDGFRRVYEARVSKNAPVWSQSRRLDQPKAILQAACETLANPRSRREYNQGLAEDEFDTIVTQVPWEMVPGTFACCKKRERLRRFFKIL